MYSVYLLKFTVEKKSNELKKEKNQFTSFSSYRLKFQ